MYRKIQKAAEQLIRKYQPEPVDPNRDFGVNLTPSVKKTYETGAWVRIKKLCEIDCDQPPGFIVEQMGKYCNQKTQIIDHDYEYLILAIVPEWCWNKDWVILL